MIIYCDSGTKEACYVVDGESPVITSYSQEGTNNEGEYKSVIIALTAAIERGATEVDIKVDSLLVADHFNGAAKCRAKNLKPLLDQIYALEDKLDYLTITWIPRAENLAGRVLE